MGWKETRRRGPREPEKASRLSPGRYRGIGAAGEGRSRRRAARQTRPPGARTATRPCGLAKFGNRALPCVTRLFSRPRRLVVPTAFLAYLPFVSWFKTGTESTSHEKSHCYAYRAARALPVPRPARLLVRSHRSQDRRPPPFPRCSPTGSHRNL